MTEESGNQTAIPHELQHHWTAISPLLSIRNDHEYDLAVERLNCLLDEIGTEEQHPPGDFHPISSCPCRAYPIKCSRTASPAADLSRYAPMHTKSFGELSMLMVKTRIDKSPIHGYGLFAAERIRRGTQIWRFTRGFDLDLDPACLGALPTEARERLLHYGYIDPRLNRYILCYDDARFINHSDAPNIVADFSLDYYGVDIATRDIEADEEITMNYALVEGKRP